MLDPVAYSGRARAYAQGSGRAVLLPGFPRYRGPGRERGRVLLVEWSCGAPLREYPGSLLFASLLISGDFVAMAQCPADVIQTLEQGIFAKRVDLKVQHTSTGSSYFLCRQVNMQGISLVCLNFREEFPDDRTLERYRQYTVVGAVIIDNICEPGCDEASEAIIVNRPGSMFTRGAAAKVVLFD